MKKLIRFSFLLMSVVLTATTGIAPLVLLTTPIFAHTSVVLGASAIDVSAITAYADEHKRPLIATLLNGLDIAKDISVIPNVKNKIALTKLTVGAGARPYSSTSETKTGDLTFADRYLETLTGKRELLIDVKDFKSKHLAWRTSPGNRASKSFQDMDFAPFTWDLIIKTLQNELNGETAYYGFDKADAVAYNAGNAYAVGDYVTFSHSTLTGGLTNYFLCIATASAGDTPQTDTDKWLDVTARAIVPGLKYHIDAAITGGFAETTTGVVNSGSTARAAFKELFRDMPTPYKNSGVIIHCSYTDAEYLMDGQEDITKYTTPDMVAMGLIPIIGTNGKGFAKPATWLGSSRRLIAEPMVPGTAMGSNLVMGTDLLSDINDIKTIDKEWALWAGISFDLGFQIQDLSALRLGDQD